jgi:putative OPT family oligopeptide transporter
MRDSELDSVGESKGEFKPFVPAQTAMAELTFKAVFLGVIMAIVLGAANAYVGMKAGLTVAATFPAAVVAMAALRLFRGSILEENVARTTASVGEALVAGAIFTLPAFVIAGVWDELRYYESTAIMLIGGTLGVLFVIVLRRTLVEQADLPFPEAVAAGELVKAGQGGQTGAAYVFSAMGFAFVWEIFKNSRGIQLVGESTREFYQLATSKIELLDERISYYGGVLIESPAASPLLVGVGFIVGPHVASVLFCGAMMGWLLLVPVSLFLNPSLTAGLVDNAAWTDLSEEIWLKQVRPIAVGTMIVAAFYTLFKLRTSLISGIGKAVLDLQAVKAGVRKANRLETDLDFSKIGIAIALLSIPLFFLYWYFTGSLFGSILLTVIMMILGFLFAAVAGYLVGVMGSSNNPISGLTLSTLLIAAVLLVMIGVTGDAGIMGVLGVAGVICCTAGIAGDMMQDLKVGHILGGTPWKMEIAEIGGVIFASLALVFPMIVMDQTYHIGSAELPAPQAGLMALMSKGIVGGEMAWPLVIAGMFFGLALILIKAPAPMLIAVGMYLPFDSTAAIFVGGIIRVILDKIMARKGLDAGKRTSATNAGILLSSGFIAGESLMAVMIAFWVMGTTTLGLSELPKFGDSPWWGMLIFLVLAFLLIRVPLNAASKGGAPGVKVE